MDKTLSLQDIPSMISEYMESNGLPVDSLNTKLEANPTPVIIGIAVVIGFFLYYFCRFFFRLTGFLLLSYVLTEFLNSKLNINYDTIEGGPTVMHQVLGAAMLFTLIYYRYFFFKLGALGALLYAAYQTVAKGKYSSMKNNKTNEEFNVIAVIGVIVIIVLVFK